ncbi:hypothetical protein FISHEDRAFT_69696 [Fistulina hepatica ATCC 64428]|uniref:Uncharacterized protein n=1 Tax=Fistulina hepatica ATCC 64428 TaxID=1128425 RepID=A0A0D7AP93_9AGAR|nr:hypothetical protein FISHEDRAFT_69696 [Fistulina hepatica ATCC 64428]
MLGVITDGDMSICWKKISDDWRNNISEPNVFMDISGTSEFMADDLRISLRIHEPYRQTPLDDLESFMHLLTWAAAFNQYIDAAESSIVERHIIEDIQGDLAMRRSAHVDIAKLIWRMRERGEEVLQHRAFRDLLPIVNDWQDLLTNLYTRYLRLTSTTRDDPDVVEALWHNLAFDGVNQFLQVLEALLFIEVSKTEARMVVCQEIAHSVMEHCQSSDRHEYNGPLEAGSASQMVTQMYPVNVNVQRTYGEHKAVPARNKGFRRDDARR